ncbi:MAG: hypothetical protein L3K06_04465, partial [Thermoplasmata archaeon]|nr:hypothetical protein [Thermoplasmata archaeon]
CGGFLVPSATPATAAPTGPTPAAGPAATPLPSSSWTPPPPPGWTGAPSPMAGPYSGDPFVDQEIWQARDRTRTGLLLLTVGIGISWIPYIGGIGGLLVLVGILLLFLGRHGFTERHRASVVLGGALLLVALVGSLVVGLWVAGSILGAATPGATPQDVANAAVTALQNAAIAAVVLGAMSGVGRLLLVWELADKANRWLLLAGMVLALLLGVLILGYELPLFSQALQQATAGGSYDRGPIDALSAEVQVIGVLQVIPSAISAFAYYRIWQSLDAQDSSGDLSGL